MITPQELAGFFGHNLDTIKTQTEGLSHADSLLQPPIKGNCLNWVLGHIVENRNLILQQLGQPPLVTEAQAKRYGYGSEPVCGEGPDIISLEDLLAKLEQSQQALNAALERFTPEEGAKQVQTFMGPRSLNYFLFFLFYHETYHLGQTEILRELALAQH